ncbi:MAG TPA: polysaccharide deacetylase family protein [Pyrinomonadaceae bacterium]
MLSVYSTDRFKFGWSFLLLLLTFVGSGGAQSTQKTVTITIDDLPVVTERQGTKNRVEITKSLLRNITSAKMPVIGFVNENKLYVDGRRDESQVDLLRMWLDAGLELGNHTYSHANIDNVGLPAYKDEILNGETITRQLLQERGRAIRYFRHPFLRTGNTLEIKAELARFLADHGYKIAPVSIDDSDYIFARAYERSIDKSDKKLAKRIGDDYLTYMYQKIAYWEKQSDRLFGRQIAQILLIHASLMNSEYLGRLAQVFRRRGYKFVDLDTALKDEAYRLPDEYTRPAGISWLHRWALANGREYLVPNEPRVPDYVMKLSGFTSE